MFVKVNGSVFSVKCTDHSTAGVNPVLMRFLTRIHIFHQG